MNFATQIKKQAEKFIGKDFCNFLNIAFYGKTMEPVRKRIKIGLLRKGNIEKYDQTTNKTNLLMDS